MADNYKTLLERWAEDPMILESVTLNPEQQAALDRYEAARAAGDDAMASAALKHFNYLTPAMGSRAKQDAWNRYGELVNAEPPDEAAIDAAFEVFNNTP